jgi:hypothetical protein
MTVAETIDVESVAFRLTRTAYDLAMRLFDVEADKRPVNVTSEMIHSKLSELTNPKRPVAERKGAQRGRFGKRGTVQLLVRKQQLRPIPDRTRSATGLKSVPTLSSFRQKPLTIDELEQFVLAYRRHENSLRQGRGNAIQERIDALQKHLAIAKGDDFRNTIVMTSKELATQDNLDAEIREEVLLEIDPGTNSPLTAVFRAMQGKVGFE